MEVFLSRRFLLLSLLAGLGRLQNTMILIALFAAAKESGFSSIESSTIAGAFFLSAALSAAGKGRLVDVHGRSFVQRQAMVLLLGFFLLIPALLFLPWWAAFLATLFLGAIRINPGILQQALWTQYHKKEAMLSRSLAWENLLSFLAQIGGPLLSALLLLLFGGVSVLVFVGLLASVTMFLWGSLAPREKGAEGGVGVTESIFPLLLVAFLLSFSSGLLQGSLLALFHPAKAALWIAVYTAGAASTSLLYFWRPLSKELWKAGATLAPLLLVAPLLPEQFLAPALLLSGFLFSTGALSCNLFVKSLVSEKRINEAYSYILTGLALGASAGVFISGPLLQLFVFWQSVLLILVFVLPVLSFFLLRKK